MNEIKYIAVVDDHTMVRKGLTSLINLFAGYKVLFDASNGQDFIRQLKPKHLPDIVLLDIVMPEMDGYMTASWVRTNFPDIKVLALSTMEAESAIIRMIKCGASGYLLKDADPTELKRAFDEVLTTGYYYNDLISRKIIRSIGLLTESSNLNAFVQMTEREMEFIKLACSEKTYSEIAREMYLSERTVDGYRDALFKKLDVSSRVGLVLYAVRNGLFKA